MRYADEQVDDTFAPVKIGEASNLVIQRATQQRALFILFDGLVESPIEEQFGFALAHVIVEYGYTVAVLGNGCVEEVDTDFFIIPQFKWGFYRSDFALVDAREGVTVLIECDGQEFHSSEEHKLHDHQKDAAAAALSMTTLRFTGSQIFGNARLCAQRALFNAIKGRQ